MQKKFPVKLILVAVIVVFGLWWLWPAADPGAGSNATSLGESEQGFVSAIQPIEVADANATTTAATGWTSTAITTPATGTEIRNSFDEALQSLNQGDAKAAISELDALIKKYPQHVEPYINLASIYASKGQLEQARKTLLNGLNADQSYATLFTNLQKINGALAANAYQAALAEEGEAIEEVELPLVDAIELSPLNHRAIEAAQQEVNSYKKRLAKADVERRQLTDKLTESEQQLQLAIVDMDKNVEQSSVMQSTVATLQTQLVQAEQSAVALQDEYKNEIARLQQPIDEYSAGLVKSEATIETLKRQLAEAQQQMSSLELAGETNARKAATAQQDLSAIQNQLQEAQQRLTALQSDHQLEVAGLQRKLQQLEVQAAASQAQTVVAVADIGTPAAQPAVDSASGSSDTSSSQSSDDHKQQAIALVSSWADAWSAQQVSDYIAHYVDGYAPPGSGMSNAAWVDQRRIRLTNKPFIEVKVSGYQVEKIQSKGEGERFSVTFLQHYRTNTMDDKIRKRLLFSANGSDWAEAKIIDEKVLR